MEWDESHESDLRKKWEKIRVSNRISHPTAHLSTSHPLLRNRTFPSPAFHLPCYAFHKATDSAPYANSRRVGSSSRPPLNHLHTIHTDKG